MTKTIFSADNPICTPKNARLALGLTQKKMAQAVGLSERQWIYYETGQQKMDLKIDLAIRYLICDADKDVEKVLKSKLERKHALNQSR